MTVYNLKIDDAALSLILEGIGNLAYVRVQHLVPEIGRQIQAQQAQMQPLTLKAVPNATDSAPSTAQTA